MKGNLKLAKLIIWQVRVCGLEPGLYCLVSCQQGKGFAENNTIITFVYHLRVSDSARLANRIVRMQQLIRMRR